ncbi:MAG TPA: adenosine deaminase [Bavariicoccus seileri]|uniref:adenosine deaminase n=1 Tax=Bavariicoccus seileri TaxID=549685 RepID=A0A3D4S432_9ENTE|nr:adenosine deaminase [Bavariicoccus seileri]HCS93252.1 adenosine deaminase [Bavariicoccus seileri]
MQRDQIKILPKVELHCHLDGSIRLETLKRLAEKDGVPVASVEAVHAPKKCLSLQDYLDSFDAVLPLLQLEENLRLASYDLIEQVALENVSYIEIRFAPLLHQRKGLTVAQIISAVCDGITAAQEKYAVKANVLVSGMRHHSQERNNELLNEIKELHNSRVVGFDFAGNEEDHGNLKLKSCIKKGLNSGLRLTLHSGECGCSHNVLEAIELGAERIGHGVAIKDDPAIMAVCRDKGTLLELCPTSNLQTNAIDSWEDYPFRLFLAQQLKCCINTDNRTVSQTSLTDEYEKLAEHFDLTYDEMKELNLNAIEGSFADEKTKKEIITQIINSYSDL